MKNVFAVVAILGFVVQGVHSQKREPAPKAPKVAKLPSPGLYKVAENPHLAKVDWYKFEKERRFWKDRALELKKTKTGYSLTIIHKGERGQAVKWNPKTEHRWAVEKLRLPNGGLLVNFVWAKKRNKLDGSDRLHIHYPYRGTFILERVIERDR